MLPAIRVTNLGKSYRVGQTAATRGYRTLRESLVDATYAASHRFRGRHTLLRHEEFWALTGVDFEVDPGEVVGVIGRNGAGKSTLLKILSRITRPTIGRVELWGRVGSLLEIGTGFHPELTGRENIFLNGSLLNMRRTEIARKFDDIVTFAEVENFLEIPVKRYSSGMYVRLAFAVAAHLEPEILLVDEVLAVGDASFQERCIERMSKLAASGRTILLVSHNMDIVPRLCSRAILMQDGTVVENGPAKIVIEKHLNMQIKSNLKTDFETKRTQKVFKQDSYFESARLLKQGGQECFAHVSGDDLMVELIVSSRKIVFEVELAVTIMTLSGARILSSWSHEVGSKLRIFQGLQTFSCKIEKLRLRPGHTFQIMLWMGSSGKTLDSLETAITFPVISGESTRHLSTDKYQGSILCDSTWSGHDSD